MPEFIRIKRSTFRMGTILLYALFLSLIAYIFAPQILKPQPGEQSLRCTAANLYARVARAAGQTCTTKCTNWRAADCSGFSACYNKNISCNDGIDQDGRACKGCCFDCVVVCEPDPDKPPTISGSVSCGQWGNNGWCVNNARLNLTASDPQGYTLSITGTAGGTSISCNGNCSIDLPTGSGAANYIVTASQSGLTASGSLGWSYDPDEPSLGLNINGATGQNGWYRSPVTITPTGSDSISGLAGAFVSINGGAWQPSATLHDGVHSVAITAADNAGNIVHSSTSISIDTTTPSINVSTNGKAGRSNWFIAKATVSASASDSMSGIASFEYSADGGAFQTYNSSITFPAGRHTIQFRAMDRAGNVTETPIQVLNIDLTDPYVNLSTSVTDGYVIAYTAQDDESGLSSVRVVIENKENQSQKISWDESASGQSAVGKLNWDGKFQDGTIVAPGEYLVWIKVADVAGNQSTQFSRLVVSISGSSVILDRSIDLEKDGVFSITEPSGDDEEGSTTEPPAQTYGGSTTDSTGAINQSLSISAFVGAMSNNSFPWALVAGATVAAGAATYVTAKPKKTLEQKRETRARLLAELQVKWRAQALAANALQLKKQASKIDRADAKEHLNYRKEIAARIKARQEKINREKMKAGREAYYNIVKQGSKAPAQPANWWEKTKSTLNKTIVQPFNRYVIQPIINPAMEKAKEIVSSGTVWITQNLYEPHLKSIVDQTKQAVSDGIAVINETVYQPIIKPAVEKTIEKAANALAKINESIIQPYIQPALTTFYEEVYQPHIEPFLEDAKETIEEGLSWINEIIYQPYLQPVVDFLDQNIYQPILKPVLDDIQALQQKIWDKYGELIHGSLDAVGVIPGLGEIADGLNGLIYLGEGRYLEAGIAALAMIPILGDLGKAGKWGVKIGQEIVEETVEKVVKETAENVVEKVARETLEETAETVVKETVEGVAEKAVKETTEELAEKAVKEATTELSEKAVKETGEEFVEKSTKIVVEKATKAVKSATEEIAQKTVKETAGETLEQTGKIMPEIIKLLEEKYGKEAVELIERFGAPAVEVLSAVEPRVAKKLLESLDGDVLDYAVKQGSDAVSALSHWSEDELKKYGTELVLRAKKDAIALDAASRLSKISDLNSPDAKELLKIIAQNSIQGDSNRIILGKWVSGNFDDGFIGAARSSGSCYYGPNPGLENAFKAVDPAIRDEYLWAVNQQALQEAINAKLIIDYSFDGLPASDISKEIEAIKAITHGASKSDVEIIMKRNFPFRMREIRFLVENRYTMVLDEANEIIHWINS